MDEDFTEQTFIGVDDKEMCEHRWIISIGGKKMCNLCGSYIDKDGGVN